MLNPLDISGEPMEVLKKLEKLEKLKKLKPYALQLNIHPLKAVGFNF